MIEEQATVIAINKKQLLLQTQVKSACGSCQVSGACGTSVLTKVLGRKLPRFTTENTVDAKVGDHLIIGIEEKALLKASIFMYLVPIVMMIFFALLANFLISNDLAQKDMLVSLSSIIGLLISVVISKRYFGNRTQKKIYSPVILRKAVHLVKLS
jgi:sigma-E factor negative regulatory protein RseC